MAAQQEMKDADISIYPDWSQATDAQTGKPEAPPNFGGPQGPYVPIKAVDVMNPPSVRNDPNRPVSIDVYRSAKPAALKVPIWVIMKPSAGVHCPK
jgi:hypothetical protein